MITRSLGPGCCMFIFGFSRRLGWVLWWISPLMYYWHIRILPVIWDLVLMKTSILLWHCPHDIPHIQRPFAMEKTPTNCYPCPPPSSQSWGRACSFTMYCVHTDVVRGTSYLLNLIQLVKKHFYLFLQTKWANWAWKVLLWTVIRILWSINRSLSTFVLIFTDTNNPVLEMDYLSDMNEMIFPFNIFLFDFFFLHVYILVCLLHSNISYFPYHN